MRKFHLLFSFLALLFLLAGAYYYPDNSLFWIASTGDTTQLVRGFLVVLVLAQLVTEPPRRVWLRIITGVTAIATALWSVQTFLSYQAPVLDSFIFMQTAIALAITALEVAAFNHADQRYDDALTSLRPAHR